MKKLLFSLLLVLVLPFFLTEEANAQQGCLFCYANPGGCQNGVAFCAHSCYPWPGFTVCSYSDCQGPNGDRCGGGTRTPTPSSASCQADPATYVGPTDTLASTTVSWTSQGVSQPRITFQDNFSIAERDWVNPASSTGSKLFQWDITKPPGSNQIFTFRVKDGNANLGSCTFTLINNQPQPPSGTISVSPPFGSAAVGTFCDPYNVSWNYSNVTNPRITYQHSDGSETVWCQGSECNSWVSPAKGWTLAGKSTSYRLYDGGTLLSGPATFTCNAIPLPSCQVSLVGPAGSSVFDLESGQTASLEARVTNVSGNIDYVDFLSSDVPPLVRINQSRVTTAPYTSSVTAIAPNGDAKVRAEVKASNGSYSRYLACEGEANIKIIPRPASGPWWQIKDADIISGGISSNIPLPSVCKVEEGCFPFFGREGADLSRLFPGVVIAPSYPSLGPGGQASLTRDPSEAWVAISPYRGSRYSFSFFKERVPNNVSVIGQQIDFSSLPTGSAYRWFKVPSGDAVLKNGDVGSRRVILIVENGNLKIDSKLTLDNGRGFFMAVVNGNIIVAPSVYSSSSEPALEGIFFLTGVFDTGSNSPSNDNMLYVRGSIVSLGGVDLKRDLDPQETNLRNNSSPSELFEFAPDLLLNFPKEFTVGDISWKEIAP